MEEQDAFHVPSPHERGGCVDRPAAIWPARTRVASGVRWRRCFAAFHRIRDGTAGKGGRFCSAMRLPSTVPKQSRLESGGQRRPAIQYIKQLGEVAPDKVFFVYYVPGAMTRAAIMSG
jgi:hypothetical protein